MIIQRISNFIKRFTSLPAQIYKIQEALGRIEQRQAAHCSDLNKSEFRVFSQWGEDGIIQYLLEHVPIKQKVFIEFGVENYTESNTRFLLTNNYWSGLIIDGNAENIGYVKQDPIYWATNLKALHTFITKENINDLIISKGFQGEIGLLSIDIDGNDYWVWESINCINPCIVICEYNAIFGYKKEVVVPYDQNFQRKEAHYSQIYYGASLAALNVLAAKKGYSLVGTDSSGNDAFFVRNDLIRNLTVLSTEQAYHNPQVRESLDQSGRLNYLNQEECLRSIQDLALVDIQTSKLIKVKELIIKQGN